MQLCVQLWIRFGRNHKHVQQFEQDNRHLTDEQLGHLDELQCDDSTNFEICQLVADFFSVLEGNEQHNHFNLYFDDLPIYYIPSRHKDRLYLMANLFTKVREIFICSHSIPLKTLIIEASSSFA